MRKISEKCMRKSSEERLEKRNKVMAPDQTSSLINKEKKSVAEIQYKTLLTENILNTFFSIKQKQRNKETKEKSNKQTNINNQLFLSVGRLFLCLPGGHKSHNWSEIILCQSVTLIIVLTGHN